MNLFPGTEKIVEIQLDGEHTQEDDDAEKNWFVNANHTVPLPSAFSDVRLSEISGTDLIQLQNDILDAFILRVMFICTPKNVGFDLLIPVLSREALEKTAAELRTIIEEEQNVPKFIGILKVSVRTGNNIGRMIPELVKKRTYSSTALTHINLGISFAENWSRDTIAISSRESDLKDGWVVNVSKLSPQLENFFQSFGENFELPQIHENLEKNQSQWFPNVADLQDDKGSS
ncbi:hypothetical protein GEMRC1_013107 [Eukaryota sp. GEM-RC1]